MKHSDTVIMVFSKAPVAGEVKTRLVPAVSFEQAARLHEELTHHCLHMVTGAGLCDVQLWCSPDRHHPFFGECERRYGVRLLTQSGGDLGERMSNALREMLHRYSKIIIIGSDAPALDTSIIEAVIDRLDRSDAVLVPAEDGGYVLLGSAIHRPGMLDGVAWGSGTVLADTLRNFRHLGVDCSLHGTCWDVDRPEDLERYRALKAGS